MIIPVLVTVSVSKATVKRVINQVCDKHTPAAFSSLTFIHFRLKIAVLVDRHTVDHNTTSRTTEHELEALRKYDQKKLRDYVF